MTNKKVVAVALAAASIGAAGGAAITATGQTSSQNKVLFGALNGKNEVGPDGRKRAGDLNGKGSATGIFADGRLCYGLTNKNISDTTVAHIHRGVRGKAGPTVIPLDPPNNGTRGASSGCVEVENALARAILRNPHRYYWNIHSTEKPGGAIRGQVSTKRN